MRSIKKDYSFFCEEINKIQHFRNITQLSYCLAVKMLEDSSSESLKQIRNQLKPHMERKKHSYCAADREIKDIHLICEWITAEEYAKRLELPISKVEQMANNHELGYTIVEKDVIYIIWPKDQQSINSEELPKFGKKTYKVEVEQKALASINIEQNPRDFALALMGKSTKTMNVLEKEADYRLNENTFLSCWSAFETFIKNIIYTFLDINPSLIFESKKIGKETITYKEIYEYSDAFNNIEKMKRMIADNIICNQEKNGQSIHSLINLIKEYFLKNEDPYNTWYVYDGIKYQIDYCTLIDIKEIRNTIVHDKGVVNVSRWKNMKLVPIPKGGIVEIDDDLFNRCLIILKAISFRINQLAQKQLSKGLSKKD